MSKLISKKKTKLIATSIYEKNLAYQIFDRKFVIDIRPNLVDNKIISAKQKKIKKKKKYLKIFFMSNITWKKNFEFVFKILKELDFAVTLNIYGSVYENPSRFEKYINVLRNKHKINKSYVTRQTNEKTKIYTKYTQAPQTKQNANIHTKRKHKPKQ